MPNRVEIAGQIDINYGGHPPHHTAPDFCQGPVGRPLRAIPVRVRAEIRLEDGFKDKLQRPLHHAITDARNLKRADFSVLLRNVYPAVRLRLVAARKKVVSYLRKGSVPNLLLIELLAKQISWLEAHTNIVETLPSARNVSRPAASMASNVCPSRP